MYKEVNFDTLQGLVLENILIDRTYDEVLYFVTSGGIFKMLHEQDCCESVAIEDVCGDPRDLVGAFITMAEEAGNDDHGNPSRYDSSTWTFYKIVTPKGDLTIRWVGTSNGYYSESVSFGQHEGEIPKAAVDFTWKPE